MNGYQPLNVKEEEIIGTNINSVNDLNQFLEFEVNDGNEPDLNLAESALRECSVDIVRSWGKHKETKYVVYVESIATGKFYRALLSKESSDNGYLESAVIVRILVIYSVNIHVG